MSRRNPLRAAVLVLALGISFSACSCGDDSSSSVCTPGDASSCSQDRVCEAVAGADPVCVPATVVTGKVFDALSLAPIEGAQVVVINAATRIAASNVAWTDAQGMFRATVLLPRSTVAADDVQTASFTLRVGAQGFQPFPSPIRQAIPLTVTRANDPAALPTNERDVALIPLAGVTVTDLGSVAGRVHDGDVGVAGVLVVAEGAGKGVSAVSDATGVFTLLNLPTGSYTIRGYRAGMAFLPVDGLLLATAEAKTGVELLPDPAPQLTTLSGGIQIVNGQTTTTETLVVLALASTGEVPAGLSAMTVASRFEIAGVPPGTYDILASYNNDDLVLDPDPSQLPRPIRVVLPDEATAGALSVANFKITGDVKILSPGAEMPDATTLPVSATGLTFQWEDDSGEDFYGLELFDSFGVRVWGSAPSTTTEPTVKAPKNSGSLAYTGPALTSGATYQWRITSYKCTAGGSPCSSLEPLSSSENLRGIFTVAP